MEFNRTDLGKKISLCAECTQKVFILSMTSSDFFNAVHDVYVAKPPAQSIDQVNN